MFAGSSGFCAPWPAASRQGSAVQPRNIISDRLLGRASSAGVSGFGLCTCLGSAVGAIALFSAALNMGSAGATPRRLTTRRAFENELGVQAPLGYFDPLGLSSDGDYETFYRRREAELKNGRVAMYATIGYIMPEFYRWPGYISPTADLTFADCPNGLNALSQVPLEGWLQILAWCGMYEWVINQPKHPSEPGNYYKGRLGLFPGMIMRDPEKRKRSLNAELANGRLAMVAIFGMMMQDGVVGGTGPEMWLGKF